MYKKILVPLYGSKLAECALNHVKVIAIGCDVPEIVLFRVVEPTYIGADALSTSAYMYSELINQVQKEAEDYITGVTETFKHNSGINAHSDLAYGDAADEILKYTIKNHVDLIIRLLTAGRESPDGYSAM